MAAKKKPITPGKLGKWYAAERFRVVRRGGKLVVEAKPPAKKPKPAVRRNPKRPRAMTLSQLVRAGEPLSKLIQAAERKRKATKKAAKKSTTPKRKATKKAAKKSTTPKRKATKKAAKKSTKGGKRR